VRAGALTVLIGSGFLAYVIAVFATGALDLRQARSFLSRRTPPPGPL
jgi:putative peptidoglycan lipid II flippase